jgi:hypothetical protein
VQPNTIEKMRQMEEDVIKGIIFIAEVVEQKLKSYNLF